MTTLSIIVSVLILVVVEDGLVPYYKHFNHLNYGRLNPCCSGRWSRTDSYGISTDVICVVLILVVVEDGLVPYYKHFNHLNYGRLNPCCSGRWSRTLDAWDEKRLTRQS